MFLISFQLVPGVLLADLLDSSSSWLGDGPHLPATCKPWSCSCNICYNLIDSDHRCGTAWRRINRQPARTI